MYETIIGWTGSFEILFTATTTEPKRNKKQRSLTDTQGLCACKVRYVGKTSGRPRPKIIKLIFVRGLTNAIKPRRTFSNKDYIENDTLKGDLFSDKYDENSLKSGLASDCCLIRPIRNYAEAPPPTVAPVCRLFRQYSRRPKRFQFKTDCAGARINKRTRWYRGGIYIGRAESDCPEICPTTDGRSFRAEFPINCPKKKKKVYRTRAHKFVLNCVRFFIVSLGICIGSSTKK